MSAVTADTTLGFDGSVAIDATGLVASGRETLAEECDALRRALVALADGLVPLNYLAEHELLTVHADAIAAARAALDGEPEA